MAWRDIREAIVREREGVAQPIGKNLILLT